MASKILGAMAAAACVVALASAPATAQSSGNFSAAFGSTACAINPSDGTLSGGITSLPDITVKVSGGNGVALVITPSLVTGLFTSNKLTNTSTSSTQNVGIRVKVSVDGSTAKVIPELGSDGVIYDQRFIKVTANFINQLLQACSSLTDPTDNTCLTLTESTLAAHAFNYYTFDLTPGTHEIKVSWDVVGGGGGEATCVGPGTVTVTQVKNFQFNTPLSFQ